MDNNGVRVEVVFLLTTNRTDLLEPAPDLYRRGLDLDTSGLDDVLARTDGVTASFLKELLRRAAVIAADGSPDSEDQSSP